MAKKKNNTLIIVLLGFALIFLIQSNTLSLFNQNLGFQEVINSGGVGAVATSDIPLNQVSLFPNFLTPGYTLAGIFLDNDCTGIPNCASSVSIRSNSVNSNVNSIQVRLDSQFETAEFTENPISHELFVRTTNLNLDPNTLTELSFDTNSLAQLSLTCFGCGVNNWIYVEEIGLTSPVRDIILINPSSSFFLSSDFPLTPGVPEVKTITNSESIQIIPFPEDNSFFVNGNPTNIPADTTYELYVHIVMPGKIAGSGFSGTDGSYRAPSANVFSQVDVTNIVLSEIPPPDPIITVYRFEAGSCNSVMILQSEKLASDYDTLDECNTANPLPPSSGGGGGSGGSFVPVSSITVYRFEGGSCNSVMILQSEKLASDYDTLDECNTANPPLEDNPIIPSTLLIGVIILAILIFFVSRRKKR